MLIGTGLDDGTDTIIVDLFTIKDGYPKRILASSSRDRYRLTPNNLIFHDGSGGATSSIVTLSRFDGTDLVFSEALVMQGDYYYRVISPRDRLLEPSSGDIVLSKAEYDQLQSEMFANLVQLKGTPIMG